MPQPTDSLPNRQRGDLAGAAAVFATALLINLLSASPGLVPMRAPDTVGYLDIVQQVLRGEVPNLHIRTPGYPLFLLLAELTGSWQHIVWIQAIVAAIAAVALWRILMACIGSRLWAGVAAVALMAAYDVSSWHGIALTESLSLSLVILWAFAHLAHFGALSGVPISRRALRWIALGLDILIMMVRPTFFFLPVLWYATLLVYRFTMARRSADELSRLPKARSLAVNLAVTGLVAIAWCGMIWIRYGRFEITIISRFNRLGNLMTLRFASPDACSGRRCSPLLRRGVELASSDTMRIIGPYYVIEQLRLEFPTVPRGAMLDSLNQVLSPAHRALVPLRSLNRVEFILAQRGVYNPDGMLRRLLPYRVFSGLSWRIFRQLSYTAVIWTVAYLVLAYHLRRRVDWVRLVFLFVVLYTASVNILGGYEGWDRLMVPVVVPLNALALLLVLDLIVGTTARFRTPAAPGRDDASLSDAVMCQIASQR